MGCLTVIVGIALSVGSCALFGGAIKQATDVRQVASVPLEVGESQDLGPFDVESGTRARLGFEVRVELAEAAIDELGERGGIVQTTVPINYEVLAVDGDRLHVEAGAASGSVIVPAVDSPHRDRFEKVVTCSFEGSGFRAPSSGRFRAAVEIPAIDDEGNTVLRGRALVSDRLPESAGRFVAGGFASLLAGPIVALIGLIVFIVGLATRKKRGHESSSRA
jgi:hypothetical protein